MSVVPVTSDAADNARLVVLQKRATIQKLPTSWLMAHSKQLGTNQRVVWYNTNLFAVLKQRAVEQLDELDRFVLRNVQTIRRTYQLK